MTFSGLCVLRNVLRSRSHLLTCAALLLGGLPCFAVSVHAAARSPNLHRMLHVYKSLQYCLHMIFLYILHLKEVVGESFVEVWSMCHSNVAAAEMMPTLQKAHLVS